MTVGERIKERRLELGMTQGELAEKAGYCHKTVICRLEHSGNDISMKQIRKMSDALECSMAYLMGWEAPEPEKKDPKIDLVETYVKNTDIAVAVEFYEAYKTASPEVRAAVELLLKAHVSDS